MKKKLNCVLLIDDDEPTNFLNRMVVEETACANHVQVIQSGRDALDYLANKGKYANADDTYPTPDLIFLDINMPAMDGWEFLEQYEQLPSHQKGKIIMVMLTTSFNPEDESKARANGYISGFKNKPLTEITLTEILNEHFADHF
ncbi:MAG: response regulator [Chitinophagaceae bacterium]